MGNRDGCVGDPGLGAPLVDQHGNWCLVISHCLSLLIPLPVAVNVKCKVGESRHRRIQHTVLSHLKTRKLTMKDHSITDEEEEVERTGMRGRMLSCPELDETYLFGLALPF